MAEAEPRIKAVTRLDPLSELECLNLLSCGAFVGRIAFIRGRVPIVVPVNYVVDRGAVVFRTNEGGLLTSLDGERVAFEVDDSRPVARAGWSVLLHGTAQRITDERRLERVRGGQLSSWAWRRADVWTAIEIEAVSGRRIVDG